MVLNYAMRSGAATLYFSADSDAFVQVSRAYSIVTGCPYEEAAYAVRQKGDEVASTLGAARVRFCFDPAPTLTVIEREIQAYYEQYGEFPELIVIDNILDIRLDAEYSGGYEALDNLLVWLHQAARKCNACVVGLHHVTGVHNNADSPVPLNGVKGQVGRVPELILTLHRQGTGGLGVSVVKNRTGKADPSGHKLISLRFQGESMILQEAANVESPFNYQG